LLKLNVGVAFRHHVLAQALDFNSVEIRARWPKNQSVRGA
jgi:hypothetical protein